MKKDELVKIIEMSLTKEIDKQLEQSDITSLIVNMFLGGIIMRCESTKGNHYYNLINNEIIDLTKDQYEIFYNTSEEIDKEYILSNKDTKNRYKILLNNVKNNFIKYGTKEYKLLDSNGNIYFSKVPGIIGGNKKLKIYGRLDCPNALNWINKGYYINNRVFFDSIETAEKNNYRPCAKCMKKEYNNWKNKERE